MPDEAKKMESVIVKKVSASREELLNCKSQVWAGMRGQRIEMGATPLANQPSPYIKATFDENKIGAVKEIQIKGVHNGKEVFFCFQWKSQTPNYEIGDIGTFPDGIAILFPFKDPEKTQIKEMGSNDYPTNSWYWRPDFEEKPKNQVAKGLSTSLYTDESSLVSCSEWNDGTWCVVMGRPLKVSEEAVNLEPGSKKATVGFAAWEGGSGERGGVKSFSKEWMGIVLEG
jgi:complex iron-sulfur molybdoenzyme family reductase subunit gamma